MTEKKGKVKLERPIFFFAFVLVVLFFSPYGEVFSGVRSNAGETKYKFKI